MKENVKKCNWKKWFVNKKEIWIFFFVLFVSVLYTYYFRSITDDELFNYGFSKSILDGLVPYLDFNMIIPPLFHYILALFLKIFGEHLIVYHIVLGVMLSGITVMCYKKIGKCAFCIWLCVLTYPYTGYNIFCLFLFFYLLTKCEGKYDKIIEPLLIVMMILSKQTLILLVIPSLIYSKTTKKTFLLYCVCALGFIAYLLLFQNLYSFFDYCLFGMFDFADKNGTGFNFLFVVEILIIIGLIYWYRKEKDKNIFYVLMFQVITFPIVNFYHFVISFAPVLYLLFLKFKDYCYVPHFALTVFISFSFFFNVAIMLMGDNYRYLKHYSVDNFMEGRVVSSLTKNYVMEADRFLKHYSNYTPYLFGYFSYLVKLNLDMPITKYDLINNGNMGYRGSAGYIEEIEKHCGENDCVFIVNEREAKDKDGVQTNGDLILYVMKNYQKRYSSTIFSVYTN